MKIEVLKKSNAHYPQLLKQITHPPSQLYYRGDLNVLSNPCISVVGTRSFSDYGEYLTEKIISELAAFKVCIVSGLARGIDTFAHKSAIKNKLSTIAIIGSGLNNIYPNSNLELAKKISHQGIILSEYPNSTPPLKHHFPQRNRLISGISLATLVIEAPERSGALITAYLALDQNREVFTIPGDIDRQNSLGPLKLIQKNIAHPISSGRELIEILRFSSHLFSESKKDKVDNLEIQVNISDVENLVLGAISQNRLTTITSIHEKAGLPIQTVISTLSILEINELIETRDGKYRRKC